MPRLTAVFIMLFFPVWVMAQNLELLTGLNNLIDESSGLIYLEGRLITHTDSEGEAALYEFDSLTGNVVRQVEILNSVNTDWEDICYDDDYIYIGDFGNNHGNRTDLKIYRISRSAYLNPDNDSVPAEVIAFHYSDQTDFTSAYLNTEYDAEAVIALGDSLYIFTKNWVNHRTYVYPIPKIPGDYELIKIDSLDIGGMASGADICPETGRILLTAYTFLQPFVVSISGYAGNAFSQGTVEIINLQAPAGYSHQIEGVAAITPHLFYITSEQSFTGNAGLYKLDFTSTGLDEIAQEEITLYPNPASDYFNVLASQNVTVHLYNSIGQKVKTVTSKRVDVSDLPVGSYIVEICGRRDQVLFTQKLIIRR